MRRQQKPAAGKAFSLNEDKSVYGVFAEIGAGQETVNFFFKAGRASQTVAKSISAYDMTFSDLIYGKGGRYVSRERLMDMLKREYSLIQRRLARKRGKNSRFFAFANTAAAASEKNQDPADWRAWMGVRFQSRPLGPYNDVILHVGCLDKVRLQQHEALGVLGVNLIYSCFQFRAKTFVASLTEGLSDRVRIDWIGLNGPDLTPALQTNALNIELLKQKTSPLIFFNSRGESEFIKDSLFETPLLILKKDVFLQEERRTARFSSSLPARARRFASAFSGQRKPVVSLSLDGKISELKPPFALPGGADLAKAGLSAASRSRSPAAERAAASFQKARKTRSAGLCCFMSLENDLRSLKKNLRFWTKEPLDFVISEREFEKLFRSPSLFQSLSDIFEDDVFQQNNSVKNNSAKNKVRVAVFSPQKDFLQKHKAQASLGELLKKGLILEKKLFQIS